jgi:hypothetical protein
MVSYGQTIADTNVKATIIKKVVYVQSDLISVGTKVIPTMNLDVLDVNFIYPSSMTGKYPVADDARASREKITWSTYALELKKAQVPYFITDSAKLRSVQGVQNTINARRAAEALAVLKDDDIIDVLDGGAGTTNTAGAYWDSESGDPESDIADAYGKLLSESNASMADLTSLALIVPAAVAGQLMKLTLIGNVQQSIASYIKGTYGIEVYPTRSTQLTTASLLFVKGGSTANHGVLSDAAARAAGVPLVEHERVIGSGDDYLISQWFKTVIVEDGSATGQTDRIVKINSVDA